LFGYVAIICLLLLFGVCCFASNLFEVNKTLSPRLSSQDKEAAATVDDASHLYLFEDELLNFNSCWW